GTLFSGFLPLDRGLVNFRGILGGLSHLVTLNRTQTLGVVIGVGHRTSVNLGNFISRGLASLSLDVSLHLTDQLLSLGRLVTLDRAKPLGLGHRLDVTLNGFRLSLGLILSTIDWRLSLNVSSQVLSLS